MSLSASSLSSGSIPPSPVFVTVPARDDPIAKAIFASLDNAPNDIAPIIIGVSILSGFSANLSPKTTSVPHGSLYLSIGGRDTCAGITTKSSKSGILLSAPVLLSLYDAVCDCLTISTMSGNPHPCLASSGIAFTSIALFGHISRQILQPTHFSWFNG